MSRRWKWSSVQPPPAEFDDLDLSVQRRLVVLFERLRGFPVVSGAKPLRGQLSGRFRLRTGDYRVQFRVEGQRIMVERVGHRDKFYED